MSLGVSVSALPVHHIRNRSALLVIVMKAGAFLRFGRAKFHQLVDSGTVNSNK